MRSIAEQYHVHPLVIFVDVPVPEVRRRWQENRCTRMRADVRDEDFAQVLEHFDPPTRTNAYSAMMGPCRLETGCVLRFPARTAHKRLENGGAVQ